MNKNKNISITEEATTFRIVQTFRDKKGKISEEKNNEKNTYDDNEGNYIIKKDEILINRYKVIKSIGKGTFGNCFLCYDRENKENVCIKIIKNLPKYNEQAKEEIKLINYINSSNIINENIFVQIKNNFIYHEHICIVFELLGNNLYEEIQKNNYNGFNILTIKKLAIQLLFGLLILKTKKIIHCDLKPENILLINKGKNNIKIIDFGSSCLENENYYLYIQSRFYRAPEILLGLPYGVEIDIWSLGCILCEFYTGIPIFPGENEYDMLYYIMEYFGLPPKELIDKSPKKRNFFNDKNEPLEKPNSFGKIRKPNQKNLEKYLKNSENDFIDFFKKIFKWKKEERITPEKALKHNWIVKHMNANTLAEHMKKIQNFSDLNYCSENFVFKAIKNYDFDEKNYNNNNKSEDEIVNFNGSFNCSFSNDNIDNNSNSFIGKNKKNYLEDIEKDEENNNSPRFASKQ